MDADELEELRATIEGAIDKLDDLILEVLRDAVSAGERARPEAERRLTRARNALRRALGALGDEGDGEEP